MCKSVPLIVLVLLGGNAAAQPGQTPPMGPMAPQPSAGPVGPSEAMSPQLPPEAMPPGPQYGQEAPPPMGAMPGTRATFVSTGVTRWDVRLDENAVCSTPCQIVVEPMQFVTLHSHDRTPVRLTVGQLYGGDVLVQAKPLARGAYATGLTFTTLSGMGLATGITLTAVGCSTDRDGMCKAGLITGAASGVGLYLSIRLMLSALPKLQIGPAQAAPYVAGNTVGLGGQF